MVAWTVGKTTLIDCIFLLCVPFTPGLNFLGERQASHEENRNEPHQHLSPWKDPEGGKGKPQPPAQQPLVSSAPAHLFAHPTSPRCLGLEICGRRTVTTYFKNNQPPSLPKPNPISLIQRLLFCIHSEFFSTTPLPKWSRVGGNEYWVGLYFSRDFLIQWGPLSNRVLGPGWLFYFFPPNFAPSPPWARGADVAKKLDSKCRIFKNQPCNKKSTFPVVKPKIMGGRNKTIEQM